MPRLQTGASNTVPGGRPKSDWTLIEGSGQTVLKTIAGILKQTGDNDFQVEFRIYRSSRTAKAADAPESRKAAPQKKRRRGLGSLTTIFMPRRKRKG